MESLESFDGNQRPKSQERKRNAGRFRQTRSFASIRSDDAGRIFFFSFSFVFKNQTENRLVQGVPVKTIEQREKEDAERLKKLEKEQAERMQRPTMNSIVSKRRQQTHRSVEELDDRFVMFSSAKINPAN